MNWFLWLAIGSVLLWLGTSLLFIALSHAKALHEKGGLALFWRVPCYVALPLFLVLDLAWNLTVGTLVFGELPRELLFTSRVKRHLRHSKGRDQSRAVWWAARLNEIDPGHVKP